MSVQNQEQTIGVEGMTCSNCARHVTDAIQAVPGVRSAQVLLEENRALVRWNPEASPDMESVETAVREAGFKPSLESTPTASRTSQLWGVNVLTGLVPTILLVLGEWALGWGHHRWFQILSFVLALIVQIGPGAQFYRGAWRQLKLGRSNMDTLVSLGSTTAFTYSAWILFTGQGLHLYFLEAAAIITLISVGHWMEARTAARASGSLRLLMTLTPDTARRIKADGIEEEIPVEKLEVGDEVVVKPGDRIPTDGVVRDGHSAVDESMLTGESIPTDKQPASTLYGGTVNLNGRLTMQVTETGQATALAQIVAAVEHAQNSRAHIQRLADRISSVFVPIVVMVALATAFWWGLFPEQARELTLSITPYLWPPHLPTSVLSGAIITAVAVLIVACPCAMGLATPAAIMAGSNAAAQRGILIRDGVALEKAGKVSAVLFDKTGTLTIGKPEVVAKLALEDEDPTRLAATLGRQSNHPLSQAAATLDPEDIPLNQCQEIRGAGVEGRIIEGKNQNQTARLGSLRWLKESGIEVSAAGDFHDQWTRQGATVLGLSIGQRLTGALAFKDTIKPGAEEVIREIERQGMSTWMITGDHQATARGIARQCGIAEDHLFAEVRPEEKARFVEQLQMKGERVAFVGDGINDAPALEQSDLGIAVSRASDIAREAADVILLNTEIQAIPQSLKLARATLRTIKQNLFWAFFYNVVAIPIAALGFMSPVLCAAIMGVSDIIVIGNALRLRRFN